MGKTVQNNYWLTPVFLLGWGVYLKTLCPTIYVGDSGELVAAGYGLGIPHPPGYPLYSLVGHLFSKLPLGEIAFRFNMFSGFFTSIAIICLAIYLYRLFNNPILSFSLAFTWAFGVANWEMANTTEVYPLMSALFIMLLLTLSLGKKSKKHGYLYLAALIYGLGLSAHYSFLLFSPGILIYLYWFLPSKGIFKKALLIFTIGLAGWLTFSYQPLRAENQPLINWGNPLNYSNMINHIKRAEYKEVAAVRTKEQFLRQFYYLYRYIRQELPIYSGFLALIGLGIMYLKMRDRKSTRLNSSHIPLSRMPSSA